MATEDAPLLTDRTNDPQSTCDNDRDDPYNHFSMGEKRAIVVVVSFAGLVPLFVRGSFVPSVPQIAEDLQLSGAVVSLAISLSVFGNALGGLVWSAYSSFYGRRPMYLWGMPLMAIGSFGAALSTDLPNLLFWRFVQAFGCSGGTSIGAAVIGDIYRREERGTALGSFFGTCLFGFAVAPFTGGAAAEYWSWRGFQMALCIWGVIQMVVIYSFLPETAHPNTRGIDKWRGEEGSRSIVWINPFRSLKLLRSPSLLMVFVLMRLGVRYNIKNDALIGAFGAHVAGRLSDAMVKKWKKSRNGVWYPEDRLQGVYIGALCLVPLSVGLAGLVVTSVDGPIGLSICLLCLFTNGVGVDMVVTPVGSYVVDLMGPRSAEGSAALCTLRSLLLAPLSALILPSMDVIGTAATNGIAALLAIIGYFFIWVTIRYGDRLRAYADVGYALTTN
ncbi:major facilitator superfamily domain-containing protein [Scleroderma yunnanense]